MINRQIIIIYSYVLLLFNFKKLNGVQYRQNDIVLIFNTFYLTLLIKNLQSKVFGNAKTHLQKTFVIKNIKKLSINIFYKIPMKIENAFEKEFFVGKYFESKFNFD